MPLPLHWRFPAAVLPAVPFWAAIFPAGSSRHWASVLPAQLLLLHPRSEQPAASVAALPAYDADPLTGEAKRSNGRIVGVMVNNISNTSRQNARPQRGLSSADLLIECKVEGGITR